MTLTYHALAMSFEGWKGDFVGFFRGLELDNSKRYFEAHRKQYETEVRGPMEALTAELSPALGPVKLFRINRDVRFSADKSPYKTNVAAVVGPLYIHLDARDFFIATGAHMPDNAWLTRYREAVAGPAGAELERTVERLRAAGLNVGGNSLKTAPRGYPADHPRIGLLRHKGLIAWQEWPAGAWLETTEAKDRVVTFLRTTQPLSDWLDTEVGPSAAPERAR